MAFHTTVIRFNPQRLLLPSFWIERISKNQLSVMANRLWAHYQWCLGLHPARNFLPQVLIWKEISVDVANIRACSLAGKYHCFVVVQRLLKNYNDGHSVEACNKINTTRYSRTFDPKDLSILEICFFAVAQRG